MKTKKTQGGQCHVGYLRGQAIICLFRAGTGRIIVDSWPIPPFLAGMPWHNRGENSRWRPKLRSRVWMDLQKLSGCIMATRGIANGNRHRTKPFFLQEVYSPLECIVEFNSTQIIPDPYDCLLLQPSGSHNKNYIFDTNVSASAWVRLLLSPDIDVGHSGPIST